jgi:predicted CoA-substrate-specific enzyme activase
MEKKVKFDHDLSFLNKKSSFHFLQPIKAGESLVTFKEIAEKKAVNNDECILGLDVGSTTTKAVILKVSDNSILAKVYLRTNGDPVGASRACYKDLKKQIGKAKIKIIGLGVTGSGRQIAGLHALTDGIINEIIAHATAAIYFDKEVDTIFEIGGQDAKYTYIVNSVPADYAMNEACSAGTGSFLEEAAKESLGIKVTEIAELALKSTSPPNFNDQCAAFISSDIKNASHENVKREDIVAGLVYSICMNYANRVKGARPVGKKIFMQGGVCYNKAVPMAMANLIGKHIIVPPQPGLMGAFGVALEVKNRLQLGLLQKKTFVLDELIKRDFEKGKSFKCMGVGEKCDRGCDISSIKIEGKTYPFGGICNKYYNLRHNLNIKTDNLNLVKERQGLVFNQELKGQGKTIGITRSFLTNTLFPLYSNFFSNLGFTIVLPDHPDPEGIKKVNSSLCFPAELAHGFFHDLLKKNVNYIFLPQVSELHVEKSQSYNTEKQATCVLLQAEPYYIKSAFKLHDSKKILSPVFNFSRGWHTQEKDFVNLGVSLGATKSQATEAFRLALAKQKEFFAARKEIGRKVLQELEKDKTKIAVVLFGRSYSAFSEFANKGIPDKFASRNIFVIPYDFLPFEDEISERKINWALGQEFMKASYFVQKHPQLFGTYITNFSCGPDSFLISYFRDIMKSKPSLTLELDSHTADAGIDTRIEAFLDIVDRYRKIKVPEMVEQNFVKAEIVMEDGESYFISSNKEKFPLKDKRVHVLFPSMGRFSSEAISSAFVGCGMKSSAAPVPKFSTLMLGRGHTSCKECLPLILTAGNLLEYLQNRKDKSEMLAYFMPTVSGNCRFAQYAVFFNDFIKKHKIENLALMTLTADNSYGGLATSDMLTILKSIIISDVMDDIYNAMSVLAIDKEAAKVVFEKQWQAIRSSFENGAEDIYDVLEDVAAELKKIPLKHSLEESKVVLLAGEIYVRKDEFSCEQVVSRLAERDIIVKRAPSLEWLYYVDFLTQTGLVQANFTLKDRLVFYGKLMLQRRFEKKIKDILSRSGLYTYELIDVKTLIEYGKKFVDVKLTGETILIIGAFMKEIIDHVHGVISIGPFACLPGRITESILTQESTLQNKIKVSGKKYEHFKEMHKLPFLSVESDGNPFPQVIEARIESFSLQVERLHSMVQDFKSKKPLPKTH